MQLPHPMTHDKEEGSSAPAVPPPHAAFQKPFYLNAPSRPAQDQASPPLPNFAAESRGPATVPDARPGTEPVSPARTRDWDPQPRTQAPKHPPVPPPQELRPRPTSRPARKPRCPNKHPSSPSSSLRAAILPVAAPARPRRRRYLPPLGRDAPGVATLRLKGPRRRQLVTAAARATGPAVLLQPLATRPASRTARRGPRQLVGSGGGRCPKESCSSIGGRLHRSR